jgi:hypothetical protein
VYVYPAPVVEADEEVFATGLSFSESFAVQYLRTGLEPTLRARNANPLILECLSQRPGLPMNNVALWH